MCVFATGTILLGAAYFGLKDAPRLELPYLGTCTLGKKVCFGEEINGCLIEG